ncbi:hypothetical protein N7470_001093 [Penicillium chermesinum]|nr:hypothetical protein N7470_001093 [Penicillium chermesinum]
MGPLPKFTARQILDAFYSAERVYMKRDFAGIAATLAPDFRMEQTSALPYAGVYHGPQGMHDWAVRMADYFSVVDVRNPEIFELAGSSRIVVVSNVHFKVRKTGEELEYPFVQVITVDLEQGLITEMRPFYWDVAALNKALGLV